jgi:hypothetical protein
MCLPCIQFNPTDHQSTSKPSFARDKVGSKPAAHQHMENASVTGTTKGKLVVQRFQLEELKGGYKEVM